MGAVVLTLCGSAPPARRHERGRSHETKRAECEESEAAGYPALEELAADSLPSVDYELHKWSHCQEDDGGIAWPNVTAVLEKGQSKSEARELLIEAGWQPTQRREWEFRRGSHEASISGVARPQRTEVLFEPPKL